jgi:hypothetical protein
MWLAQLSASTQSLGGRDIACNMQVAISLRDLFFLSATHSVVECKVLCVVVVYLPLNKDVGHLGSHIPPHCLCGGF